MTDLVKKVEIHIIYIHRSDGNGQTEIIYYPLTNTIHENKALQICSMFDY